MGTAMVLDLILVNSHFWTTSLTATTTRFYQSHLSRNFEGKNYSFRTPNSGLASFPDAHVGRWKFADLVGVPKRKIMGRIPFRGWSRIDSKREHPIASSRRYPISFWSYLAPVVFNDHFCANKTTTVLRSEFPQFLSYPLINKLPVMADISDKRRISPLSPRRM